MSGSAWVGKPWFKNFGCFNFDSVSSNSLKRETANVSSYVCASYCRDNQYLYIGMTITHCFCFKNHNETENKQVLSDCEVECPGNKIEKCGNQNKVRLLQKVDRMRNDVNDFYRQTFRFSENGVRLKDDSETRELFFFCEYSVKGVSSLDDATVRTIESTSIAENEIWNGLTIGVVVGVIVIFVIGIVVCVYCKLRNKKGVCVEENGSGNPRHIDATVGIRTAYEDAWSDQEPVNLHRSDDNRFDNNVYDHASHKVLRENNDFMLYDIADAGNEEYNITAFGKQHFDPTPQQIKSNNYQLNDYDTCASVEMKTK
ncbi:uncharacterized protein LOC143064616 [Mytilus galloprovincialis]|uniref:uncharacterized protein LOC143064616 n=1 Tax=Mytilus galloprovincialis TaxID=29158 RepID=UPI003F7B6E65